MMHPNLFKLVLLLSVSLTAGCALADALSGEDKARDQGTQPRPDMAADMAQDMAPDLAQDMAADLAPDADMAPDMAEDMTPDMEVVEGATLAECLDEQDMNGQRCGERGGACVMRAQGRYACVGRDALRGCMERVRLGGISAGLPVALVTDARGKLHAFGVDSADAARWVHFRDIGDSMGLLAASAGRKEAGPIKALAAIAAPDTMKQAQVAIAAHHETAEGPLGLALSVWEGMNSYKHNLSDTRPAQLKTSQGSVTIGESPCAATSPLMLSQAPAVGDMGGAALTISTCHTSSNMAPLHATTPVRIEPSGVAVWGEAYAPSGYTLESVGLGRTGLGAPRIWFMSRDSTGDSAVRGAEWETSQFASNERAMGPGASGFIQGVDADWLDGCGQEATLVPGARSMVLPHPTLNGRAQLFVQTGAGPQVLAWDDMAHGGGAAPEVTCGEQSVAGLEWVDRVAAGSRWLGVGTVDDSDVGVMGGTWALDETSIQRLDLDQPTSAKALATDGSRVWLLAARRGEVLVVELTREGAPVCLE